MFLKLNLQLFAATDTTLNLQTTLLSATGNDLSKEMKTFYDKNLIRFAEAQLVHDQFADKRPIPKNGGKKIEMRYFDPLAKALTPLTEGVTPSGNKLNVQSIEAEVAQYGDYITQSDVLELTAIDNTIAEATKLLGRQAGMTLDTITRNALAASTNKFYCPKVSSAGVETAVTDPTTMDSTCQLTVKVIQQIVATLRAQNAPTIGGKYVAIIHPYVAYDLMRDPEWRDAHLYTGEVSKIYAGELGEIAGVRFVSTSEALITKGGTYDPSGLAVFHTFFLGEGAYAVTEIAGGGLQTIVKQKGSAGTADPLDQRSSVGWKAIKAAKVLIQQYMVHCYSTSATYSDTAAAN